MFGKKGGTAAGRPGTEQRPNPAAPVKESLAPVSTPPSPPETTFAAHATLEPVAPATAVAPAPAAPKPAPVVEMQHGVPFIRYTDPKLENADFKTAKRKLVEILIDKIDFEAIERIPTREGKRDKINESAASLLASIDVPLNSAQVELIKRHLLDEVLGFGPIEPLLNDTEVSDIMINGSKQIYIEKSGKLLLSDVTFTSEQHLLNVIQKIVALVGRRVDETSPMVDARMPDGSRFNAIIPPLALDGSIVSIRKFKKNKMPISQYVQYGSMTPEMCKFLEICGNIRINILVSGGTGSGKTTMLNALSGNIDPGERVITIEDAAELQMHQPHVLRLETRPPNIEGAGEITQRQLVKNALRMRPDRIILGEIRGDEVIDVLAAMNTGHDGSMATIHSNNPRDCLSRIENLVGLAGLSMPTHALRLQIASALHVVVQVARMRDGRRRVTHIEEVVGLEGDTIVTQLLFGYKPGPMGPDGLLTGEFFSTNIRPRFFEQALYFNRDKEMLECLGIGRNMV